MKSFADLTIAIIIILIIFVLFIPNLFSQADSVEVQSELTSATDIADNDVFYIVWDSSGTWVARNFKWTDLKSELAKELIFNQNGFRVLPLVIH